MTSFSTQPINNSPKEPRQIFSQDQVEELFLDTVPQPELTNFQKYCQENPDADECRIYDV